MNADSKAVRHTLPEVLSVHPAPDQLLLRLKVPANLDYFPGHFPVQGILPGVVQIDWVVHFARQYFSPLGRFAKMEVLKFQQIILPDSEIHMQLTYRADTQKVLFEVFAEQQKFASGRLVFNR